MGQNITVLTVNLKLYYTVRNSNVSSHPNILSKAVGSPECPPFSWSLVAGPRWPLIKCAYYHSIVILMFVLPQQRHANMGLFGSSCHRASQFFLPMQPWDQLQRWGVQNWVQSKVFSLKVMQYGQFEQNLGKTEYKVKFFSQSNAMWAIWTLNVWPGKALVLRWPRTGVPG